MSLSYVISSAVWSVFGACAGYYVGRMRAEVSALRKKVNMDQPDGPGTVAAPDEEPAGSWWELHRPPMQRVVGIVIVLMALASVTAVAYQTAQLKQATTCYLKLAQATATALRARDADSQQARNDAIVYAEASAALWQGFLTNAPAPGQQPTPAQRDASLKVLSQYFVANRAYVASQERAKQSAKHYPLPSPTC
jgi:hypothetical protein